MLARKNYGAGTVAPAVAATDRAAGRPLRTGANRAAWTCLAACTAAAALLQLDGTLITVALPSVARNLDLRSDSTSIVLSAYFGAYAMLLLPGGALVDRFGPRPLALIGLSLFGVGAAAGALSTNIVALLGTRVVQGAGAGLVSPAALAGAVSGFAPEHRGRALGVWGASAGISNLLGPLLGGLLTVALGWRADWWALVPLTLLAAWAILVHLSRIDRDHLAGPRRAWSNPVVVGSACIAALTFAVMIGTFFMAEQYLQRAAGYSALGASTVLVFVALLVGAMAPVTGRLADRHGERRPATAGFLIAGTGLLVLGLPGMPLRSLVTMVPLVPVGLGLGLLFVPVSRAALNAIPPSSHGRASALLSVGRLSGAALGAALAGVALTGGPSASAVHTALLVACAACLLVGIPACRLLEAPRGSRAR